MGGFNVQLLNGRVQHNTVLSLVLVTPVFQEIVTLLNPCEVNTNEHILHRTDLTWQQS